MATQRPLCLISGEVKMLPAGDALPNLTITSLKSSAYNAAVEELIPCDISGGPFTVTLPSAPADGSIIEVLVNVVGLGNSVTVAASGTDVLTRVGGPTSIEMYYRSEWCRAQYKASQGVWYLTRSANPLNFAVNFPGISAYCPLTNEDITINTTTRVLSITPARGHFEFFVDGEGLTNRYRKTGTVNFPAFTDTSGIWYFYFNSNGDAVTTQTPWSASNFSSVAPVYRLLWNASLTGAAKLVAQYIEYHVNDIPADTHQWMHLQGSIWGGGSGNFDIKHNATTGTPNADGRNAVVAYTSGSNIDDNLEYTVTNSTAGTPWTQDLGETAPASLNATNAALLKIFTQDAGGLVSFLPATRFPFAWNASTNRAEVVGSTGTRSAVADNNWFVYFVYATQNPVAGEPLKLVSFPTSQTSIANARAINWTDIQATYPTIFGFDTEIRPMARLIFYTNNSGPGVYNVGTKYTALQEVQDLRKLPVTSTATASGSLPASSVTFVPTSSIPSTNVQEAIETVDANAVDGPASAADGNLAAFDATTGKLLKDSGIPAAPGGTTTFLRADKTWAVPPGSGGGAVTFNEPAADNSAGTVAIFDSATVGESVAFPDLLYLKSDGKWWKADADAAATMPGLRMALESKTADQTCSMLVAGRVRDDDWNWTVGGLIFASTTAGALTQTAPSGAADVVQIVGVAYHADKMLFAPETDSSEVQ